MFNFLDVVESESATRRYKEKEIKHGRLAMVAMLGFFVQVSASGPEYACSWCVCRWLLCVQVWLPV